jgi:tetratricopeptide (TPR) repeat protein
MNKYSYLRARSWLGPVLSAFVSIAAAATPVRAVAAAPAIAYVEEDYAAALKAARARRVPLIAELWAPWCHSCRMMDAQVFTDVKLIEASTDFVWLRLNIDRAANEAFVARHQVDGVPALLAIDPADESKLMLRMGIATAPQVIAQLIDVEQAFTGKENTALASADRDYAEGRHSQAAKGYRAALDSTSLSAASRARAFEALTTAYADAKSLESCATTANEAVKKLPASEPVVGQIAALGLQCALDAPADAGAWRATSITSLEPVLRGHVKQHVVLFENRAVPYQLLAAAREQAGDKEGAERMRKEWVRTVMQVANNGASAPTRAATASLLRWAAPKAEDCVQIMPALKQIAAESPEDYLPLKILALCYAGSQQPQPALDAITRSLALMREGSEMVGTLRWRARLEKQIGNSAAARQSLQRALTLAQTPGLEPSGWTMADLQEDLKKL